ncbi:MAG: 50S ribosomal protein L29 [Patescibacteria group bacterium]|nr:50S ribosomal protein L29 [Patescibacteria group bacterium]MDD5490199.1 50S ribosomal protein L29 [Patescibacteria group bacterium]
MEFKDLKAKSPNELARILSGEKEGLREKRFKVAQRQLKKVSDIKKSRKIIARILTLFSEKKNEKN